MNIGTVGAYRNADKNTVTGTCQPRGKITQEIRPKLGFFNSYLDALETRRGRL